MTDSPLALITGANRGIGFEVARQLGRKGYHVLLGARNVEGGQKAQQSLESEGIEARFIELDMASAESIEQAAESLIQDGQALDALVNNAAVHYDDWQDVTAPDFAIVDEAMAINTLGPWRLTVALLPLLRKAKGARLVMVSSGAGALSSMNGRTPAYSLSKIALNGLTQMFAKQLKSEGILVNAVCPGWTATDMGGGGRPVPEGAAGVTWAATLEADGPTGGFFRDETPIPW